MVRHKIISSEEVDVISSEEDSDLQPNPNHQQRPKGYNPPPQQHPYYKKREQSSPQPRHTPSPFRVYSNIQIVAKEK